MKKSHKQELLSLLGTMGKIADLLPNLADPSEQIQDILAACECIRENLETEAAPNSLGLLQIIETSLKESKLNILEYAKKLKITFDSEVKANREALFLPYKASMWDSLESIYLAAKEDPNWDALVMPIPYYDKKDGKLTEMHWEISYPKNIPLTDWQKYNIEERHPDIIFIHNPYDGYNIVTSVHPDFYSEKLRNFTDCLVYVPYFVGSGLNVAEHFCTVPGCIFAHKVIVQTEEERKIYVRTYKEFAKRNRVPERFEQIGSKFLALGSPKLDKAITAKREDYEIPADWEKLICNKKVVFYNTSIGALLEHSQVGADPRVCPYLRKVRSVFEFFRKQNDAVLLWRPHPLLESTIKSMRPWLEREYAEIVREYKSGGYGIYDDSEDLNRAIALSDMYYGDGSSVAKLFEVAGKPVTLQLFDVQIFLSGIYACENSIWFIDNYNILYKHNKQSNKTESVGIIPEQKYRVNIWIAENKRKLYFAPLSSNKISIFDMSQKNFEQIDFRNDCSVAYKFQCTVSFKNFVYFIPREFPAIMRLNTNTNEIEYFSEWVSEVSKLRISKLRDFESVIFFHFCIADTEIALVINGANTLMFFNMETGNYEIKHIGEGPEQYGSICFDGQNYYLSSFYGDYIVKWNRQTNKTLKIKLPASFSRKIGISINFLVQYLNGYIWLFPHVANNAYKINVNTDEITELPEFMEFIGDKGLAWNYNILFADGNFIYASTINKGIAKYNTENRELNSINDFKNEDFQNETALALWLRDGKPDETAVKTENAGKAIWGYFK
jgi:hypothetical protein